jgi:hypothetical protein
LDQLVFSLAEGWTVLSNILIESHRRPAAAETPQNNFAYSLLFFEELDSGFHIEGYRLPSDRGFVVIGTRVMQRTRNPRLDNSGQASAFMKFDARCVTTMPTCGAGCGESGAYSAPLTALGTPAKLMYRGLLCAIDDELESKLPVIKKASAANNFIFIAAFLCLVCL